MNQADEQACMAYLYGDVADGEEEAACFYEYARESKVLCKAAAALIGMRTDGPNWPTIRLPAGETPFPLLSDMVINEVVQELIANDLGAWWIDLKMEFRAILFCSAFPERPWTDLTADERKPLMQLLRKLGLQPLRMLSLPAIEAMRLLDDLRTKMEKYRAFIAEGRYEEFPDTKPLIDRQDGFTHCFFALEWSKTRTQLIHEFGAWLDLPENKQRLKLYARPGTGTTGKEKDALRDLTKWRLKEHCGTYEAMLRFVDERRQPGRALHDARVGQTERHTLSEAPLFRDPKSVDRAIARAKEYLRNLIPWEFNLRSLENSVLHGGVVQHRGVSCQELAEEPASPGLEKLEKAQKKDRKKKRT